MKVILPGGAVFVGRNLIRVMINEGFKPEDITDMIKVVLKQLGGFRFSVFLPVGLFKFLMMAYQRLTGNIQFTPDQVDSLTPGEIFPNYAWRDEFGIDITSFEEGVRRMMEWNE